MIGFSDFLSGISRWNLFPSLAFYMLLLIPEFLLAANPGKPDFWVRNGAGTITHTWTKDDSAESMVMNMQGRKVVMQVQSSLEKGLNYTTRFFNVKKDNFNRVML